MYRNSSPPELVSQAIQLKHAVNSSKSPSVKEKRVHSRSSESSDHNKQIIVDMGEDAEDFADT